MNEGDTLPAFSVAATSDRTISPDSLKGRWTVFYFYPKDQTPGCTRESQDFRDLHESFQALGCDILGVSRDSMQSHDNFRAKQDLPFDLVADTDSSLCNLFGVIGEKKLYGRTSIGLKRSTFLVDDKGIVRALWRNVRVAGHADKVLERLGKLQQG